MPSRCQVFRWTERLFGTDPPLYKQGQSYQSITTGFEGGKRLIPLSGFHQNIIRSVSISGIGMVMLSHVKDPIYHLQRIP